MSGSLGHATLKIKGLLRRLQEDACLVASFIQMNVFCVQDLQTRPQKTALSIKNTWMPKKLSSEAASCRRPAEEGNGHGVQPQGLPFLLAMTPAKNVFLIYHSSFIYCASEVIYHLESWP